MTTTETANLSRDLQAALIERAAYLRMLGALYLKPLTSEQVAAFEPEGLKELAEQASDPLEARGYDDMYRYLRKQDTGTRQALNVDFTGAFYGVSTYEGLTAEPYESLYTSAEGMLMGQARTAVNATYRRWQVEVGEGIDLPDDHLSFELEFLATLTDRCATAVAQDDLAAAEELLDAQASFAQTHLLNWFDRFYNLSNKLLKTRFYRGVNRVAKAFVHAQPDEIEGLRQAVLELGMKGGQAA